MSGRELEQAQDAVALALEKGADGVVASSGGGRSTQLSWRNGKVETVVESDSNALSLRLYAGGRYAAHSTNDLRPDLLDGFMADAVALTRALEEDPHRMLPDPALYEDRAAVDLDLVDSELVAFDRDRALAWLAELEEVARDHESVLSVSTWLQSGSSRSAVASSNGLAGAEAGTGLWYGASVTLRDGDDRRPEAGHHHGAIHLEDLPPPKEVAAEALRLAVDRLGARKAPSMRATMVVRREAAASLVARMLGALSAGSIQQRRSFLADCLGERVASTALTLLDEPHRPRGFGSCLFDGEGLATRPRPIIEEGVLRSYYVDTYYGRKLGWEPTIGSPTNVVVTPGTRGRDDLLADVSKGIYVTDWIGGNADPTTGDFSFGLQGQLVEDGELARPVAEMNVTGNLRDLFSRLAEVGDDPGPCSTILVPTLVFEDVDLAGS